MSLLLLRLRSLPLQLSASVLVMLVLASPSFAQAPECALQPPKPVNLEAIKPVFQKHFCIGMTETRCEKRWSNLSPLMEKLATDKDVPTVGTAAYMLATTFVETGIKDFDPGTVEITDPSNPPPYAPWIGRGWVQLTYADKYQAAGEALNLDLTGHPKLALDPENSYRILVWAMTTGALEKYRSSPGGGPGTKPIKLGDFVNTTKTDYGHARAVINANCTKKLPGGKGCPHDVMYEDKGYLPPVAEIDAATLAASQAKQFEAMLCAGMGM